MVRLAGTTTRRARRSPIFRSSAPTTQHPWCRGIVQGKLVHVTPSKLAAFRTAGERAVTVNTLLPVVYDELRRLAARHLQSESRGHTLQATALAHEVYLKLIEQTRVEWAGRAHVMAIAAALIRRVLVDHARAAAAQKRGAGRTPITLTWADAEVEGPNFDVLDVNDALAALQGLSARQAAVVELKFFGDLTNAEIAEALGISETLVKNEWRFARAWLAARLGGAR